MGLVERIFNPIGISKMNMASVLSFGPSEEVARPALDHVLPSFGVWLLPSFRKVSSMG